MSTTLNTPLPTSWVEAEEALHAAARKATGLHEFGAADHYRGHLRKLLESLDSDLHLDAAHRERVFGLLLRPLTTRLYSEAAWRAHPECLRHPIRSPVIVTGLPRSGTTALHNLLATDPQFQGIEKWLITTPMIRPPRAAWPDNPHFQAAMAFEAAYLERLPNMRLAHAVAADQVDECLRLIAQSFLSNLFPSSLQLPSFDEYLLGADETAVFQRFANNLRLIGAHDRDKRWLLKNPSHLLSIDAVLAQFPDACIVQTHRSPLQTIASLCSTIYPIQQLLQGTADPKALGARESRVYAIAVERVSKARETHPERFHDVDFQQFNRDPLATVRGIYSRFGLTPTPGTEQGWEAWIKANARDKQPAHRYTSSDFGLSAEVLRHQYRDYMQRHRLLED